MSTKASMVFFNPEEFQSYENVEYNPNKNYELLLDYLKNLAPEQRVPSSVVEVIIYENKIIIKCEAFFLRKDKIEIDQSSYEVNSLEHVIMLNKVLSGEVDSNSALYLLATGKEPSKEFDEVYSQMGQVRNFRLNNPIGDFLSRDFGCHEFDIKLHPPKRIASEVITKAIGDYINSHTVEPTCSMCSTGSVPT
jgi:hypothetical protein